MGDAWWDSKAPFYCVPRLVQRVDRMTVIYTLEFSDPTDRAVARIIAQASVRSGCVQASELL